MLFSFISMERLSATHLVGGEISYTCSPTTTGANFNLTFKIYQDCIDGITEVIRADAPLYYAIYENSPTATYKGSGTIIKASDSAIVAPEFSNDCISNYPNVCLREVTFNTTIALPASIYGYTIVYQRCCRNFSILNLIAPGTLGVTYSSTIPPFEANTCANNSPRFNNVPPQIICASNPFVYDFSVTDPDGDSLVYKLCPSFLGASETESKPSGSAITAPPFTIVPYNFGYSFDNPMPGFPPLYINPATGLVSFLPSAAGRYQVKICVDEYRNGVYLNTHSRDLQILVTNCTKNVVANTPLYSEEPNVYMVNCRDYTIRFENTSIGGFSYSWDFGDGSPTSDAFQPTHTYADTGTYRITLYVNPGSSCSDSISRLVKIYPVFSADFDIIGSRCPGELLTFVDTVFSSLENSYSITWDFGDGNTAAGSNPTHTYTEGGNYQVVMTATSEFGCVERIVFDLGILAFAPFAGNDTIIVLGYDFSLNATGGTQYLWTPSSYLSNPNIPNPQTKFTDTGYYTYVVQVGAEEGCNGLDTINILVVKEPSVLLPNAFSPNGDGLNDAFKPLIVGYPFVENFKVFNRYGNLVHVTYNRNVGWNGTQNGKQAEAGVYFYELNVRNLQGEVLSFKGDVTLLR